MVEMMGELVDVVWKEDIREREGLSARHSLETQILLDLFCGEQSKLVEAQTRRQELCPVCDYRSMNHLERLALHRGEVLLRRAHTLVIRDEKRQVSDYQRVPAQQKYWDLLSYDVVGFQRALLGHAQSIEFAVGNNNILNNLRELHQRQSRVLEEAIEVQIEARQTRT